MIKTFFALNLDLAHGLLTTQGLNRGLDSITQNKIKIDSSQITVTPFKEGINDRYNGNDFNYDINDTGGINLLQSLLSKFFNWLRDVFGININFIDYKTLEMIIYGLLAVGALYLLIRFLLENPIGKIFKEPETTFDGFKYVEEHITEVDFEKLISQAISDGNLRLATRFLYLKSLKSLASKQIIEWHFDKTNNDYLNEIKNAETRQLFKKISYVYDYVWYGEFPLDRQQFEHNKQHFSQLQKAKN